MVLILNVASACGHKLCNSSQYNWAAVSGSKVCDYGVDLDSFVNGKSPCKEPYPAVYKNGMLVSSTKCNETYKKQQMTLNCLFALSNKSYYTYSGLHPVWQNTSGKGADTFIINGKTCKVNIAAEVFNPYYVPYRGNVNNIILPDGINFIEGGNEYFSTFMINLNCGDGDKRYNWIPGYTKFDIRDRSFYWSPVSESYGSAFFGYNFTKFLNYSCNNNTYTINDTTSPFIVINSPNKPLYNVSEILFDFSVSDNIEVGSVWFSYNGTNIPYFSPVYRTLSNGDYNVNVFANDSSGNLAFETFHFIVASSGDNGNQTNQTENDTLAPSLIINSPINGTVYGLSLVIVDITATDDKQLGSVWFNYNGTNIPYSSPKTLNLTNGNYILNAFANDSSGNLASQTVYFTVNFTLNNSGNQTNQTNQTNYTLSMTNVTTIPGMPFVNNGSSQKINISFNSSQYPLSVIFKLLNSTNSSIDNKYFNVVNSSNLPLVYIIPANLSNGIYYLWMNVTNVLGNSTELLVGNFTVNRTKCNDNNDNRDNNEDDEDDEDLDSNDYGVIRLDQTKTQTYVAGNGALKLGNVDDGMSFFRTLIYWLIFLLLILLIIIMIILIFRRLRRL